MSRTLFISDLHLDTSRPAVTRALAHFLEANRDCDALYILGDLFEAWPGDDDDSAIAAQVKGLLRRFSSDGPALFIMVGNRDFLLGETFCRAVGATLLPDPTRIDLYSVPTLLMHGDSLCTADHDYQAFREKARDPMWQATLLSRSLAERRDLGTRLRQFSTEAKSNKAEDIMDVAQNEVDKAMLAHNASVLIHGHTHRPADHKCAMGTRWVLGDWAEAGWVLEVKKASYNLYFFNI